MGDCPRVSAILTTSCRGANAVGVTPSVTRACHPSSLDQNRVCQAFHSEVTVPPLPPLFFGSESRSLGHGAPVPVTSCPRVVRTLLQRAVALALPDGRSRPPAVAVSPRADRTGVSDPSRHRISPL